MLIDCKFRLPSMVSAPGTSVNAVRAMLVARSKELLEIVKVVPTLASAGMLMDLAVRVKFRLPVTVVNSGKPRSAAVLFATLLLRLRLPPTLVRLGKLMLVTPVLFVLMVTLPNVVEIPSASVFNPALFCTVKALMPAGKVVGMLILVAAVLYVIVIEFPIALRAVKVISVNCVF